MGGVTLRSRRQNIPSCGSTASDINQREVPMGTNWKFVLAALAGIVVGAAGIEMLSAQVTPTKAPPAYLIAEIEVTDPEGYKKCLLSRICGELLVPVGRQGCDRARFPWRDTCGTRTRFWWSLAPCC